MTIKDRRRRVGLILLLGLILFANNSLRASCIVGQVIDTAIAQPVNWATVRVLEINRAEPSHDGGRFQFCNLRPGTYTLVINALGYRSEQFSIRIVSETDTVKRTFELEETLLQTQEVVIVARNDNRFTGLYPSRVLSGSRLQQQLGGTLAATIASEPGVSQQSMGPVTARPVLRGMSGNRLAILEDGIETGDASALSADHAVTADPLATERIEIVRGPASYLYSSNALGGVINISRESRIANLPDQIHGWATLQGESVSRGIAGGTSLRIPVGPFALFLQGSYRTANDVYTPAEKLENTNLETIDLSAGGRYPFRDGSIGVEASYYQNHYGLPGGFIGAHPNGVSVEMNRWQYTGSAEFYLDSRFIRSIKLDGNYIRYHHREIESGGVIGTEYGILTSSGALKLYHDRLAGIFDQGVIGLQGSFVDFAANGVQIPQTDEGHVALSLFEEKRLHDLVLSGAIRFDYHRVLPSGTDTTDAGVVRNRQFIGLSGGITLSYAPDRAFSLGLTLSRTWRKPNVQELFSDGPHLAAYSYEVGNVNLEPETGLGIELSSQITSEQGFLAASLFRNSITNYIIPQATGDTNFRTFLPLYQHLGKDALLTGAEVELEWSLIGRLTGIGTLGWVIGADQETDSPLPWIPPLNGRVGLRHQFDPILSGITLRWASSQDRVGEFEEPTSGYVVFDLFGQLRFNTESTLHTIVISIDNIFNMEYRNHLSRIKAVYPEPGRNLRLLYRLYF